MLTPAQLSDLLTVSEDTLERMRGRGDGPRFFRAGAAAVRYRMSAVTEWIAEQEKAAAKNRAA